MFPGEPNRPRHADEGGTHICRGLSGASAGANRWHCRRRSAALSARARQLTPSALEREPRPERGTMLRVRTAALFVLLAALLIVPASATALSPARAILKQVNAFRPAP